MGASDIPSLQRKTLQVKNLAGHCCIILARRELMVDGVEVHSIRPGFIDISIDPQKITWKQIEALLAPYGFSIIKNREKALVEQIKNAMTDLVQNSTYNAMVRNSDYLVERFGMSYPYLSTLFTRHENMTLEKFTIQLKIDKVKELIILGDLTLSEIAYMMGYSSVQYLSTQFKSVTGLSVTDFKSDPFRETSNDGV